MGESSATPLKLQFDRRVRLDFRGATITSDAGLLACRELDAALGLTETANDYIHESRTGRNVQHSLLPLLRQSVYSRLAGYEDTNDAERLAQDPAMRVIVGWQGTDKQAASTNNIRVPGVKGHWLRYAASGQRGITRKHPAPTEAARGQAG